MKHLGDITKIHGEQIEPVDCITFGSPCQDLSIAGRRAGLAGGRSGLFVEAVRIIKEMRKATNGMYPTFAIWENVPGAFSSNGGEDFRVVLEELARVEQPDASIPRPPMGGRWSKAGAIAGNGWSLAWRQLDAQYWGKTIYDGRTGNVLRMGTPQRRKRIALVADFRGQRAGEILFERTSLSRHPDPCIPAWKETAGLTANCPTGNDRVVGAGFLCGSSRNADSRGTEADRAGKSGAFTVNTVDRHAVAYALQNQNLCIDDVLPFDTTQITSKVNKSNPQWGNPCHPLAAAAHPQAAVIRISDEEMPVQPMVLESNQVHATVTQNGICPTLPASMGLGGGYVPMITERKIFDARENGDGQIVPIITGNHESRITDYTAIAVDLYNGAVTGDIAAAITCRSIASHSGPQVMESYGIGNGQAHASVTKEKSGTLDTMHDAQAVAIEYMELPKKITWIVRRLTPTECERLQGYPDGWTDIGEWTDTKGKKHKLADSQRYKALGNSIALPQWFWLVQKMRPYLKEKPTLGSLFDGLGGFPLVWQRAYGEGTACWASEIESFCVAVTKRRFGEE